MSQCVLERPDPRVSPPLRRLFQFLVLGCVSVRPLHEADDGPAAPRAQQVRSDEKDGQGRSELLVEQHHRFVFAVFEDKNDDHRHNSQEEDQVNPPQGAPPLRETG